MAPSSAPRPNLHTLQQSVHCSQTFPHNKTYSNFPMKPTNLPHISHKLTINVHRKTFPPSIPIPIHNHHLAIPSQKINHQHVPIIFSLSITIHKSSWFSILTVISIHLFIEKKGSRFHKSHLIHQRFQHI